MGIKSTFPHGMSIERDVSQTIERGVLCLRCFICTGGWFLSSRDRFVFRSNEELKTFKCLTFNISQTDRGIFTHSTEYIEKIEVAEIDKPGQKDIKLLPH